MRSSLLFFFAGCTAVALLGACATQKSAARSLAAQKLGCPEDSIKMSREDHRIYSATGCGLTVRIACHDPYDSTGAAKGWADPLTAGNRAECEDIIDRPPVAKTGTAGTTTTTSAQAAQNAQATGEFDRDLAAKVLTAAADRARTCRAPNGPTGEGQARVTFASDGTVSSIELDERYANNEAGRCVQRELTRVSVTRFDGGPVTVKKSFVVE